MKVFKVGSIIKEIKNRIVVIPNLCQKGKDLLGTASPVIKDQGTIFKMISKTLALPLDFINASGKNTFLTSPGEILILKTGGG